MTSFTSIGYGDVTGTTSHEYLYQMLVEIVGICIFSSIIAHNVGVILSMGRPNGSQPRYDESSSLVGS